MMPLTTLRISLLASIDRCRIDEKSMAKIAMTVSAHATPSPDANPERRLLLSVRWMQSTATGPTVIEAAMPTPTPCSSR